MKILVTAYDCRPMLGGVATYVDAVTRALSILPNVEIKMLARAMSGSEIFDERSLYPIKRLKLSNRPELAALQLCSKMKREIDAWQPDFILNFMWLPESVSTYILTRFCLFNARRIPYFIVAYGVEILESHSSFKKRVRGFLSPVKRLVFRSAERVFSISQYTEKLAKTYCDVSASRSVVISAAVEHEKFSPGERPPYLVERYSLSGKKIVLTLTRLVDYKGIDSMIRAFRSVLIHEPEAVYLIVGTGPDEARLKEIVRTEKLENCVLFVGEIADRELVDHYRLCDCFVMLSREDLVTPNVEGFGLVYLEAAACGKPTLAGRCGGAVDAIEEGITGLLVNPEDLADISRALIQLLSNPEASAEMGRRGRLRVVESYNWSQVASRIAREFAKCAE